MCSGFQLCSTLLPPHKLEPVHGISQARILKWAAVSCSRDLFDPGIEPASPALADRFFYYYTTWEAHNSHIQRGREENFSNLRSRTSLVAQMVKNPPAMQETWVQALGWEDPLEKGESPLWFSGLKDSMGRGAWQATVHGVTKSWT